MSAAPGVWTDVGDGVRVRRSRAYAMNSALLLDGEHAIVVDPGVLPSELDELAAAVSALRPAAVTLFLTHAHWDHVLGRPWFPDAEVIAHDRFAIEATAGAARALEEATRYAESQGERWTRGFQAFRPSYPVSGLHYTSRGPWHLVFRDALGHSTSQLTLHVPDRKLLFAADMLSDIEVPSLDASPAMYRETLETLWPLAEHGAIETLVPGHGAIAVGSTAVQERLRRDLAYLDELEQRVTAARRGGRTAEASAAEVAIDLTPWGGGEWNANAHAENVRVAWRSVATAQAAKPPKRSR